MFRKSKNVRLGKIIELVTMFVPVPGIEIRNIAARPIKSLHLRNTPG